MMTRPVRSSSVLALVIVAVGCGDPITSWDGPQTSSSSSGSTTLEPTGPGDSPTEAPCSDGFCPGGETTCTGESCGSTTASDPSDGPCIPRTCAEVDKECRTWSDGCGGWLDCGPCPDGFWCAAGGECLPEWTCLDRGRGAGDGCDCGCGAPDPDCDGQVECWDSACCDRGCPEGCDTCVDVLCEQCSPSSCAELGRECGEWGDDCGGSVDCGGCGANEVCSAGQCEPAGRCETCGSLGHECGKWSDGCGETLNCGSCGGDGVCSGGACKCEPKTCDDLGNECGKWSDGCGGQVNCGGCANFYECSQGQCEPECVSETFYFDNKMPNTALYSAGCGLVLQEYSYMYVCDEDKKCSEAIPYNAWTSYKVPWGGDELMDTWCCYVDGTTCFDPDMVCTVNGKQYPCNCWHGQKLVVADTCPSEHVTICQ